MRNNEDLVLIGPKVILVPYKPEHVPQYHEWMKSPFLQEMTASEPLTLQEEYDMQQSWHLDDNKCTFIILAIAPPGTAAGNLARISSKKAMMIGDVNLFFNDPDNDKTSAEIEIMIAEEKFRRFGYGYEAINMMMAYAMTKLDVKTFEAKISLKNQPSIDMFKLRLGFRERSISTIFEEVTLDWVSSSAVPTHDINITSLPTPEETQRMHSFEKQLLSYWQNQVSGIGLGSTAFIPSNPFYQLLDMANPALPWVHLALCCAHAIVGLFGIDVCRKHSYAKTKTYAIASWAFILFAIPWDITYLVFANDLQTHVHNYCYNITEPVDLKNVLGTSLTCDEIRLAPPVVGVITIMLLLLKLYFGACVIAYALRLRTEEIPSDILEEPYGAPWLDYGYNDEDIRQYYFRPGKHY